MANASFEPGTSRSRVLGSAVAPYWLGWMTAPLKSLTTRRSYINFNILDVTLINEVSNLLNKWNHFSSDMITGKPDVDSLNI